MVKSQNHNLRAVIGIIFMLAASPLAVTYVQADVAVDSDSSESKSSVKESVRAILAERIVDGKLLVRHFEVSEDASSNEVRQTLMFDGETHGWAYVNGKAYNSGIVLFNGKAIKVSDHSWKLSAQGTIEVGGRNLDLDLSGRTHAHNVIMHGTATNEELQYRIILSGNIAQFKEDDTFVIALIHAGLKNAENAETIKLYQLGQVTVQLTDREKSEVDSFKNSILVA
ncbi:MAG: hypothetical protein ACE5RJ_00890 [Nitrosopumilaceae archaeon]